MSSRLDAVVTRAELLQGWSEAEVLTVEPERLAGLHVPAPAVRFLAEVGLPRAFEFYFTTIADRYQDPGVDAEEGACLLGPYEARGHVLLRLGSNYGGYMCVAPDSGRVIQLPQDDDQAGPLVALVNSSVEMFVAFLLRVRMRQLAGRLHELDDDALEARAEVFRQALAELDPPALADEEAYWSVVVEQMGYGHL